MGLLPHGERRNVRIDTEHQSHNAEYKEAHKVHHCDAERSKQTVSCREIEAESARKLELEGLSPSSCKREKSVVVGPSQGPSCMANKMVFTRSTKSVEAFYCGYGFHFGILFRPLGTIVTSRKRNKCLLTKNIKPDSGKVHNMCRKCLRK